MFSGHETQAFHTPGPQIHKKHAIHSEWFYDMPATDLSAWILDTLRGDRKLQDKQRQVPFRDRKGSLNALFGPDDT